MLMSWSLQNSRWVFARYWIFDRFTYILTGYQNLKTIICRFFIPNTYCFSLLILTKQENCVSTFVLSRLCGKDIVSLGVNIAPFWSDTLFISFFSLRSWVIHFEILILRSTQRISSKNWIGEKNKIKTNYMKENK